MSDEASKRAREEADELDESRKLKRRIIAFVVPREAVKFPWPSDAELDAVDPDVFINVDGVREFLAEREAASEAKRRSKLVARKAERDAMRTAVARELEKHLNTSITDVVFAHEVGNGKRPDGTVTVYARFFVQFRAGTLKKATGESVVDGTVHHLAMRGLLEITLTDEGERSYALTELEGRSDLPEGENESAALLSILLISRILRIIKVPKKAVPELTPRIIGRWRESELMPDGLHHETDSILVFVNYTRMVEAETQK